MYKINPQNAQAFAESLETLIPSCILKLVLIENGILDPQIAAAIQSLSRVTQNGVTVLTLINNKIGDKTLKALSYEYLPS